MTPQWAVNLLTNSFCLRPGERVLILTDSRLEAARAALASAAADLGASDVTAVEIPGLKPLAVVPRRLLALVAEADVIVSLQSGLDLSREDPFLRAAKAAFHRAGRGRWGYGATIDEEILQHELNGEIQQVVRAVEGLSARLEGVDHLWITTPAGTDLRLRIGGRPIHRESGPLASPGTFGNLPAGEVFVAPLEGSAEGQLVVDLCLGDLPLDRPVHLEFQQGRVVRADGGNAASLLKQRLGSDPWAWTIGEFGIGANPFARLRGCVTIDEKALGTIHIALGANQSFGGRNPAATHYDCVLSQPTLRSEKGLLDLEI